jgi:hypothetical protein
MHRTMKAAVAALACTLVAAPAFAQTIDKIKQTGTITVGPFPTTTTSRKSSAIRWTSARASWTT